MLNLKTTKYACEGVLVRNSRLLPFDLPLANGFDLAESALHEAGGRVPTALDFMEGEQSDREGEERDPHRRFARNPPPLHRARRQDNVHAVHDDCNL